MGHSRAYLRIRRAGRRLAANRWFGSVLPTSVALLASVALLTGVTLLTGTAAAAGALPADTTPPTVPGPTTVAEITETSVRLTWTASSDDVGVTEYEVSHYETDVVWRHTTPINEISISGLRPSRTYGFSVRAVDAAGNSSPGNGLFRVTMPPGDSQPPTAPGLPVATELTSTSVWLTWSPSRDNVYVNRYEVVSITPAGNVVVGTVPQHPPIGPATRVGNLTPGTTYTFAVRAVDDAGNVSALSESLTLTTPPQSTPGCSISYRTIAQWYGGYQVELIITNDGPAVIDGWTLSWTLPPEQRLGSIWGAELVGVVDGVVTVRSVSYTARIPVGGNVAFGMTGIGPAGDPPTAFLLNGAACQTAST